MSDPCFLGCGATLYKRRVYWVRIACSAEMHERIQNRHGHKYSRLPTPPDEPDPPPKKHGNLGWIFLLNLSALTMISVVVIVGRVYGGDDSYIRFGPGDDSNPLVVVSLNINSWLKYFGFIAFLIVLAICDVVISQTAMVIIYNSIYNYTY